MKSSKWKTRKEINKKAYWEKKEELLKNELIKINQWILFRDGVLYKIAEIVDDLLEINRCGDFRTQVGNEDKCISNKYTQKRKRIGLHLSKYKPNLNSDGSRKKHERKKPRLINK
jgi:hypothetical protein